MKFRHLIFVSVSLCLMATACSDTDDEVASSLPNGATPSSTFAPNNLPDEPYADDAVLLTVSQGEAPFSSLELMADGHYLLLTDNSVYDAAPSVFVGTEGDGRMAMRKSHAVKRTRGVSDDDGTISIPNGKYGTYEKIGDKTYRLSNGLEVSLSNATDSLSGAADSLSDATDSQLAWRWYANADGTWSRVYVDMTKPAVGDMARSLCRAWRYNSLEMWGFMNGAYVVHGKQTLSDDGHVDTYFKGYYDYERDDFLDEDYELCYKVVFTTAGTYICFYLDGDMDIARWSWVDRAQGTLYYEDIMGSEDYDDEWNGYVTVRFAGRQMRVYEDRTEREDGVTGRLVVVNTLTAEN